MPGPVFLAGERLDLRTVEPDDVPFLHRWSNDPGVRRGAGEQSVPLSLAAEERHLRDVAADDGVVSLPVCLGEERIGAVELEVIDVESDVAKIAYWPVPE